MAAARKKKGSGSGFDASYLSDLSHQADEADIFGGTVAQKHEELTQEIEQADQSHLPHIFLHLLHDNPYQGRRSIDQDEIQKLADDIKEHGFQGALAARPHPTESGAYQIVWGHRRRKAAEMAGLTTLPVLIKEHTDEDMLFLQAKENLLREQLTPLDEAFMFQNMQDLGYTQIQIAEKVRQSRGYVRNRLALVKAPEDVQQMVRQDTETVRAAYYLSDVQEEEIRAELIAAVLQKRITGESIPGYLMTLREQQSVALERQKEAASLSALASSASSPSQSDASPVTPNRDEKDPARTEAAVPASIIATTDDQQTPKDEPRPQVSVESTDVQEYIEVGKLRKILSQLENYQRRLTDRQPSAREWMVLQSIERLAHALREKEEASTEPRE